jgi:hypothetical protein
MGKGIDREQFKQFMIPANKMLAMEIASVPEQQKNALQKEYLHRMVDSFKTRALTV